MCAVSALLCHVFCVPVVVFPTCFPHLPRPAPVFVGVACSSRPAAPPWSLHRSRTRSFRRVRWRLQCSLCLKECFSEFQVAPCYVFCFRFPSASLLSLQVSPVLLETLLAAIIPHQPALLAPCLKVWLWIKHFWTAHLPQPQHSIYSRSLGSMLAVYIFAKHVLKLFNSCNRFFILWHHCAYALVRL